MNLTITLISVNVAQFWTSCIVFSWHYVPCTD